ncbi:TRAP-type C4-dicarboxylate transport system, substrate-binding protein [Pseudomonas linyingensis]|uniref:TRAP-type C4-dicarboxylate transport system, substrate-binding protein n=1 Tax=Pseudomonas linyingensis TaxID=915471 RepID=A0A1H7AWU7_9PSED|nr:TRAP transporter substrate-binding protein [Pseudomonas linyingensis]SEJ65525.1 TRAP-type C4-dicarboxylate transport system, substrate-binding protein [Pseudomonas linyingensis]
MTKMKVLAVKVAMLAFAVSAHAAETHTIRFSHFLSSNSFQQKKIFEPWCEKISKESEGRLQCQIYPSMLLGGTPAKQADMVRNGVADIVWTAPSFSAGKFPRIEAVEQAFLLPYGSRKSNQIIWNFYQQYAADDFKGYKVLALHGDGGMSFHTRNKPVRTIEDLSGMRVRTSSRASSAVVDQLGAVPVTMPPPQMTEALSKGVIDGVLFSWANIRDVKVDEVTDYHSDNTAGYLAPSQTVLGMLMSQKTYTKLPDDLKAVIDRNSGQALVDMISGVWEQALVDAHAAMPADKVVKIEESEYQRIQDAAVPARQQWVTDVSEKGIDGDSLIEGIRRISSEVR